MVVLGAAFVGASPGAAAPETPAPSHPVLAPENGSCGFDDPIARYGGMPNLNSLLRLSVMQGIDQWVGADRCSTKPHTGSVVVGAAGSISAGESATPITYTHCRSGTEVALWRFTGSGQVWPGGPLNMGPRKSRILAGVGRGIIVVNADETMWQFFERDALPSAPG